MFFDQQLEAISRKIIREKKSSQHARAGGVLETMIARGHTYEGVIQTSDDTLIENNPGLGKRLLKIIREEMTLIE